MAIFKQRAEALGAEFLAIVPHPDAYPKPWSRLQISLTGAPFTSALSCLELSLAGRHQDWNASLAVQVCREWLKQHKESKKKPVAIVERCRQWTNGHDQSKPMPLSTMMGGR